MSTIVPGASVTPVISGKPPSQVLGESFLRGAGYAAGGAVVGAVIATVLAPVPGAPEVGAAIGGTLGSLLNGSGGGAIVAATT